MSRAHRNPASCTKQRVLDFLSGKRRLPKTASRNADVVVYCRPRMPAGWTPYDDRSLPPAT